MNDDTPKLDWPGIRAAEARALEKQDRLPRCENCGRPMWCGQHHTHHTCNTETKTPNPTEDPC